MNWRRGLFRLWIVLASIWGGIFLLIGLNAPSPNDRVWVMIFGVILDMSHICSGSLIGYFTNKEKHYGTQAQRRIQA